MLVLTACTSKVKRSEQIQTDNPKALTTSLYLRGDFTLWDAEPHYKLKMKSAGIYTVKAKFMTPGKVYEFKIADKAWSEGYNCGYKDHGTLSLNIAEEADCKTVYNYFSFKPKEKGWYVITFDNSKSQTPKVMISKA
jgi:hypothetical protein